MNRIGIIFSIAALAVLTGCEKGHEVDAPDNGGVRMTLMTDGEELVTKATMAGVDELNENLIKSIHYYFFDSSTGAYVYDGTQTINKTGSAGFSLSGINQTKFDSIFSGSRDELSVFVVANATSPSGSTTLAAIKATALSSLSGFGEQGSFVMTGEGTLTKTGSGTNLTAETDEIKLKRVASKITLKVTVQNTFTDLYSNVWEPQLDKVQIDFNNLCRNGLVGATEPSVPVLGHVSLLSTNNDFTVTPGATTTEISLNVPVYSYPREWENGDDDTPYIYITIPWKWGSVEDKTYYKILLPGTSVDPNCWYDISAALGGLGSLTKDGTVNLKNLNINISKNWKDAIPDANNTDADMAMPRVLAVEQNTYILYNQNEVVIPFVSSHNCTTNPIVTVTDKSHPDAMGTQQSSSAVVNNETRTIKFTHNLLNDQSSKPYDYQVYKAHFTLQHDDDPTHYHEEIYIEQRPALCIEPFDNAGKYWNVFVDGYQKTSETGSLANNTDYYKRGGSANTKNVYTVTASVLTGGFASYKIGDPRMRENQIDKAPYTTVFENNPGKYIVDNTTNHHLTYYYPASSATADVIAPSFRIASTYGGTGTTSSTDYLAFYNRRCASYQEAGYPAGRWRLPTDAELKYCLTLQADNCIGTGIFRDSGNTSPTYYISASGQFYGIYTSSAGVKSIQQSSTGTNCRCVYDAWYWDNTDYPRMDAADYTDSQDDSKFVWGDQPITW